VTLRWKTEEDASKASLAAGSTWGASMSGGGDGDKPAVPFATYGPASRQFPARPNPAARLNPHEFPTLGAAVAKVSRRRRGEEKRRGGQGRGEALLLSLSFGPRPRLVNRVRCRYGRGWAMMRLLSTR
jgi:hypothetical protein